MIVRPYAHWFRLLFVWRGSVLHRILSRLGLVCAVSLLSMLAEHWWIGTFPHAALSIPPFALMGIALAIFLGFRNSVSFERYWEARKLWGGFLIAGRSLTRQLRAYAPQSAIARQMAWAAAAVPYALCAQIRAGDASPHLQRLLPAALLPDLAGARSVPSLILRWLGGNAAAMQRAGEISDLQLQSLERHLDSLCAIIGACERIAATPIPYTYRVLMNRTVTIYCLLLPIGLTTTTGWLTPLVATFIAYTFFALDVIGEELEDPFGTEPNDLPLDALCHGIECAIGELLDEPVSVPAPQPHHYILT